MDKDKQYKSTEDNENFPKDSDETKVVPPHIEGEAVESELDHESAPDPVIGEAVAEEMIMQDPDSDMEDICDSLTEPSKYENKEY